MAGSGVAGRGSGSDATGEKRSGGAAASGGPAGHATSACFRCAFWQHHHHHPASNLQAPTQLRVALVDSDPVAHEFVRQTLKAHAKGWTLDTHRSPDSLLAALDLSSRIRHHASPVTPHVVLMEVWWPGLSGIDFIRRLTARLCEPRLVIFTACADDDTIVESVAAGALGYLIKPTTPAYLVAAVSEAAQGRSALCSQAQDAVVNCIRRIGASKRCKTLSWREREVMLLLVNGASSSDIARKLFIEEGTVHRHRHNIFKRLNVHSIAQARRIFAGGG